MDITIIRGESIMTELRSSIIMSGDDAPFYRSLIKAMGYTDHELNDKPIIGIANGGSYARWYRV